MRWSLLALFSIGSAARLAAQTDSAVAKAAETIAADELIHHVGVIADDSMLGRDTPSRGLDLSARYVAQRLANLGLKTYLGRFPIPGQLHVNYAASRLGIATFVRSGKKEVVTENGESIVKQAYLGFDAVRFVSGSVPESNEVYNLGALQAVLVTGRHTVESARQAAAKVRGKIVIYVPPANTDSALQQRIIEEIYPASKRLIALPSEDSATFSTRRQAALQHRLAVIDDYLTGGPDAPVRATPPWAVYVWPDVVQDLLAVAGVDVAQARAESAPTVQQLPPFNVWLDTKLEEASKDTVQAPNVIAILEGSDPALSGEYVVFTAHMDNAGANHTASALGGADDNVSGIAGLIGLAKAFSQPGVRPRRSLIFLGTSGGAKAAWGASYFVENSPIDLEQIVASINLDQIGRASGDSVIVHGVRDVDLAMPPSWVAGLHPELHLSIVDGGSIADVAADHSPFVRRIVPSLYVHGGNREDARAIQESRVTIDAEQEVRILRLLYYVGQQIANADKRPTWTPEGRLQRLKAAGH